MKSELRKRGIGHHGIGEALSGVLLVVCLILMYVSTFAKVSKIETLAWIANLPAIDFPIIVRCVATIALISGLTMTIWASLLLSRKGGLGEGDESIIFVLEGPYKVVRHPIAVGMVGLFVLPQGALNARTGSTSRLLLPCRCKLRPPVAFDRGECG